MLKAHVTAAVLLAIWVGGGVRADQNTARFLANPDMGADAGQPDGWKLTSPGPHLRLSRDAQDFTSGPASLRLETVDGPASGDVGQLFLTVPDEPFTLGGQAKLSGHWDQAQIVVQGLDAKFGGKD